MNLIRGVEKCIQGAEEEGEVRRRRRGGVNGGEASRRCGGRPE